MQPAQRHGRHLVRDGQRLTPTSRASASAAITPAAAALIAQAPTAAFGVATRGLTASFTDTSLASDGGIASRVWDFGDGSRSTLAAPNTPTRPGGTYRVTLTVTGKGGASAFVSRQVVAGE
jgi:PKD repeat protein